MDLERLKGLGEGPITQLVEAQTPVFLPNLFDFCRRVGAGKVNRRALEALIRAGAFRFFGRTTLGFDVIARRRDQSG